MQGKKYFLKAVGTVSGLTIMSRFLGLARDVLTAAFFGTSVVYDAFVVAFMFPNFFKKNS